MPCSRKCWLKEDIPGEGVGGRAWEPVEQVGEQEDSLHRSQPITEVKGKMGF